MPQSSVLSPRFLLLACDRIVIGGILFLILFTPLAFGAVHPWAFSFMEAIVFLLVTVWMSKLLFEGRNRARSAPWPMCLPLLLFVSFILLQLLPLPPSLLRFLSPATYTLYSQSLPGWPEKLPYEELFSPTPDPQETSTSAFLSVSDDEQQDTAEPFARSEESLSNSQSVTLDFRPSAFDSFLNRWRSLSIAPSRTGTVLLKFLAYTSLFFLVLLYPFAPRTEERFLRAVLLTVLCTGLLVTCIAVVQQFTWNGKILWFFIPYGWGEPNPGGFLRARGPFINSDHLANYLALVFPLALVGVLSPRFFTSLEKRKALQLFCGLTAFLLFVGILLSFSRGGWIGTALGVGVLLGVVLFLPEEKRPSLLRRSKKLTVRFTVAGLILLLGLALFFVGPSRRSGIDVRLEQTLMYETSLWARVAAWQDSLGMVRDFPFLGVGLGAWPELFPRYQRPPWSPNFYVETHNDYLQLLAETGLIGFGLLTWFFCWVGRQFVRGLQMLSPPAVPVFAALVAALGTMAFHEFFDFNLQIPANAFLFTLFLAIVLRLPADMEISGSEDTETHVLQVPVAVGTGVVALLLLILALRQERIPYPYKLLEEPTSLAEAREVLLAHPARSSTHLALFGFLQDSAAPSDLLLKELEIALWLDPANPAARDLYVISLFEQGREEEELQQMTQSIRFAPSLADHFYLNGEWTLSPQEQSAVEEGFKQALATGYERVVDGLGAFYAAMDRFSEQGRLYEEAALREEEPEVKTDYLFKAALAYIQAEERERAETLLRQGVELAPEDVRPYQYLATRIFAPRGELDLAKAVIAEGVQNGADPFFLSLALAEAAQKAGNKEEARTALLQALTFQPSSFETHLRLGQLYLQESNFDRAVLSLRKATDVNPSSASAFYYLGIAEEKRYQFFAAKQAYARAVELDPDNTAFQRHYQAFLRKGAESGEE